MTRKKRQATLAAYIVFIGIVLAAVAALARPGGGDSFGGGGGGGDGDGGIGIILFILEILIRLAIEYPEVGVPLLLLFVGGLVVVAVVKGVHRKWEDWTSGGVETRAFREAQKAPAAPRHQTRDGVVARRTLESLRTSDPNFSVTLLEDFLYNLYALIQQARGAGQLALWQHYLGPAAYGLLSKYPQSGVFAIVVGAMRFRRCEPSSGGVTRLVVEYEANYSEGTPPPGRPVSFYTREHWALVRRTGLVSRPPERITLFGCPNCAAPLDQVLRGTCSHCGEQVSAGSHDWFVEGIQVLARDPRPPMLTGTTVERGTELPTVADPEAPARLRALQQRDPHFDWGRFLARVTLIFTEFQTSWSSQDLGRMRPFLSDTLFRTQEFWIAAYRQQGLRNITEGARIQGTELARVTSDRFYDAITLRVRATSLDFTLNASGQVVAGSRSRQRPYTEYWTLIRGSSRSAPSRDDKACSNCGAPLKINMAGHCEFCEAKLTSGEFDWVLSRIEQDEVYTG